MELKVPYNMCMTGNLDDNWSKFKQRFELFLEASEKMRKPDKLKVALLLTTMGSESIEIFNSFKLSTDDSEKYATVMTAFDNYFQPKKNTVIARYRFFNCKQNVDETVDSFVTNLKNLSKDCQFGEQEESLIRDLLIIGIRDVNIKEKLLIESDLSLTKALEYCRAKESSQKQIEAMNEETVAKINVVKKKTFDKTYNNTPNKERNFRNYDKTKRVCYRCGTSHEYRNCPAYGKKCKRCKQLNHYAVVCKNKAVVYNIEDSETQNSTEKISEYSEFPNKEYSEYTNGEENLVLDAVISEIRNKKEWKENVNINGLDCSIKIDTGAEVSIISKRLFERLKYSPKLKKPTQILKSYSGHHINVLGTCMLCCKFRSKTVNLEFHIVDQDSHSLLSLNASEQLGILCRSGEVNDIAEEIFRNNEKVSSGKLEKPYYEYDGEFTELSSTEIFRNNENASSDKLEKPHYKNDGKYTELLSKEKKLRSNYSNNEVQQRNWRANSERRQEDGDMRLCKQEDSYCAGKRRMKIDDMKLNIDDMKLNLDNVKSSEILIDSSFVGKVIGKKGSTIRELQSKSKAYIKVLTNNSGASDTTILLLGTPKALRNARFLIEDLICHASDSLKGNYYRADGRRLSMEDVDHEKSSEMFTDTHFVKGVLKSEIAPTQAGAELKRNRVPLGPNRSMPAKQNLTDVNVKHRVHLRPDQSVLMKQNLSEMNAKPPPNRVRPKRMTSKPIRFPN